MELFDEFKMKFIVQVPDGSVRKSYKLTINVVPEVLFDWFEEKIEEIKQNTIAAAVEICNENKIRHSVTDGIINHIINQMEEL